jgi:transketolase
MELNDEKIKFLETKAREIRIDIVKMLAEAGSGHSAGPLGMADIFSAFYFHILNHDPKNPDWPDRDRLILSNGHICPVRYAAMAESGYFPLAELKTLRKINSRLQGHPYRLSMPGLETTSGPLGCGLAQAIGLALSAKLDRNKFWIYCFMSDAEQQEGNTWEAVMFAGKNRLNNLITLIDRNNIQISGFTEEIMPLDSLRDKYESFGWHVLEIDGHNFEQIVDAVNEAKAIYEKPSVIVAHTVPGKGVSFMERDFRWHGKAPSREEAKLALKELKNA